MTVINIGKIISIINAERWNGAQKRTRTSTPFRVPAPEAGASTNSAIWATGWDVRGWAAGVNRVFAVLCQWLSKNFQATEIKRQYTIRFQPLLSVLLRPNSRIRVNPSASRA